MGPPDPRRVPEGVMQKAAGLLTDLLTDPPLLPRCEITTQHGGVHVTCMNATRRYPLDGSDKIEGLVPARA